MNDATSTFKDNLPIDSIGPLHDYIEILLNQVSDGNMYYDEISNLLLIISILSYYL